MAELYLVPMKRQGNWEQWSGPSGYKPTATSTPPFAVSQYWGSMRWGHSQSAKCIPSPFLGWWETGPEFLGHWWWSPLARWTLGLETHPIIRLALIYHPSSIPALTKRSQFKLFDEPVGVWTSQSNNNRIHSTLARSRDKTYARQRCMASCWHACLWPASTFLRA